MAAQEKSLAGRAWNAVKRGARYSVDLLCARVNERPIWIVGHPRSGTTAIAQLLGDYSGLSVTQEIGWATRYIRDLYSGSVDLQGFLARQRITFSRDIVQAPGLTPILDRLMERFPAGRFVYVVRDPRDVVCSVITMSNDGDTERFEISNPDFILFRNEWMGIMERDPIRSLAMRWRFLLEMAQTHPDTVFRRYEDFFKDRPGFIESLAAELGLRPAGRSRLDVERQFRGHRRIRGAQRWRRMLPLEAVGAIESICGDAMREFAYPLSASSSSS